MFGRPGQRKSGYPFSHGDPSGVKLGRSILLKQCSIHIKRIPGNLRHWL
ncbi:hypothetical protein L195_g064482, partial [Trifolium pratense]